MVMLKLEEQPPLIQAIFSGEIEDVKTLLENKPDVNYQDAEKRSPLHAAAYRGDRELAELLLTQGARVNSKDSKWLTPLHRACGVGADDLVDLLLRHKADTTARDRQWQTPLHIAAATNAIGCIQHLLNHITNVNVTDRAGCTALHHAAHNGHIEVVALLLIHGSIINACDKKDCRPLHWAARLGHVDTVNLLIQHGADINVKDRNQYTPLHAAAASGMVYVCGVLLSAGADVNAQNTFGNTPLHIACLNGHPSVCQMLLSHRANVEAVNYKGQTPLHISAVSAQGVGCLVYLLDQDKVDINKQSADGRTPLHMSAIYGRFTRSKRLIDKGAIVDCADKNGNTPLHIAAQYGHDILTTTLLNFGAVQTKKGYEGRTPLHVCCLSGFVEVCRKFLQTSVDLDVVDDHGRTPIHCAAYKGSVECLDLLVSRGGNFKLQDNIGRTALHYAALRGHYNCVYTLVGIGAPVNLLDAEGCSALHLAAAYDTDGKCVEYLLQHKADPLHKDNNGFTPVHYAVNGSNLGALELLLKNCKQVNSINDMTTTTPLHLAAKYANMDVLRTILQFFPDTNIKTKEGYTPLLIAAREGHTANVQMLLRFGAKVSICDDVHGMSPVHYSARNGHKHCLALLVDNAEEKTIIDKQDKYKRTALMLAISGSHQDCASTLIKNSDPNIVDSDLHSSLFRAIVSDQNFVVQLLIANGANVTEPDINGKTVLHLAAACGHLKCLQKILKSISEKDALALDKNGFSALHWACYYGNTNCLDYLLQQDIYKQLEGNVFTPVHCAAFTGSERCIELLYTAFGAICIKARDMRQRTPLHLASWHGHADCVRYLLDNEADVESRDELGRTPLLSAAQNGQSQVIDLLLAHKADLKAADINGSTALHVACLRKHNHTALLLLEYISDNVIINMMDNDKKTALHLAARNGLVEVTAELIKKGASVLAADNNGLTPALYCAPNACVAQCLAIILANHPLEVTTDDQQLKGMKKFLKHLLRIIRPERMTDTRVTQTDLSLQRNPQEFLVEEIRQKRKKTAFYTVASNTPTTKVPKQKFQTRGLTRSLVSLEFSKEPSLRSTQRDYLSRHSNNLVLIENYVDDFDVSNIKRARGGLGLHRSFSEVALVKETFDQTIPEDTGNDDRDSFQLASPEEILKAAAYEKLMNGYKNIAMKVAQIRSQYDVSIEDIHKAYLEQYEEKKDLEPGEETTIEYDSIDEKNIDDTTDIEVHPSDSHEELSNLSLAKTLTLKRDSLEISSENPVDIPDVRFVSPVYNVEKTVDDAASSDVEVTGTCIGTATDNDASDTLSQGDWLYESTHTVINRYCDCEYVCSNCVLMNRFDEVSLEQAQSENKFQGFSNDYNSDDEEDELGGGPQRHNSYEYPKYTLIQPQKANGNLYFENGDIDIGNDLIPLENLTVTEPRQFVGEGVVRKIRSNKDTSNSSESKPEKSTSPYLKEDCKTRTNSKEHTESTESEQHESVKNEFEEPVNSNLENFWPTIILGDDCDKNTTHCNPEAVKVDDSNELETDPSHELDWSLFNDCVAKTKPELNDLDCNQPFDACEEIVENSELTIFNETEEEAVVNEIFNDDECDNSTCNVVCVNSIENIPPKIIALSPLPKLSMSSILTSLFAFNNLRKTLKLNKIPLSILRSFALEPGPTTSVQIFDPFRHAKLIRAAGLLEYSSNNEVVIKKNPRKRPNCSISSGEREPVEDAKNMKLSSDANEIAQNLVEQLKKQEVALAGCPNAKKEKRRIFGIDTKARRRSKQVSLDAQVDNNIRKPSECFGQLSGSILQDSSRANIEPSGDTSVSQPCKKPNSANKLKRYKRQDDNKCIIS